MNDNSTIPIVSIGVPVCNGAASLFVALASLTSQTFSDIEIIISDNASTDGTADICREFAEKDSRVRYHRQAVNVGAANNFKFVLDQARGRYYMWAAHDDSRSLDFLDVNVRNLERNPSLVGSTSMNKSLDKARRRVDYNGLGSQYTRMRTLVENIYDSGSMFYALLRTDVIRRCSLVGKTFPAADWAVDLYLLQQGEIDRVPEGEVFFGNQGISTRPNPWGLFAMTLFDRIWPSGKFTMYALHYSKGMSVADRLRFAREVLYVNRQALKAYYKYHAPWLFR